jgi:hypothetical protein
MMRIGKNPGYCARILLAFAIRTPETAIMAMADPIIKIALVAKKF